MNALLVTDHADDDALLTHALRLAGLAVGSSHNLSQALIRWEGQPADLLVLALREPDPLAVIQQTRKAISVFLVLIVDPVPEDLYVRLLESGADWVIERPYNLRRFVAYLKVMMRRAGAEPRRSRPILRYETIELNPNSRTVRVTGQPAQRLSQLEFRLLHCLMLHPGQVLTTDALVEQVWGYTGEGDRSLVRGLINRLRTKIEANPHNPVHILTVSGVGYTLGGEAE